MARGGEEATDQSADVPGTPPSVARNRWGTLTFLALRITLGFILLTAALLKLNAGRLDQQRDWFAATPVAVLLQDGQVIAARDGAAAERPDPGW